MDNKSEINTGENATPADEDIVRVGVILPRRILDWLKAKTGADADATAIACYIRKAYNA